MGPNDLRLCPGLSRESLASGSPAQVAGPSLSRTNGIVRARDSRWGTGRRRTSHRNALPDIRGHEAVSGGAMEVPMSTLWEDAMVDAFRQTAREIALFLPKLLALLTFLVLGVVGALVVRFLLLRILKAVRFDLLCERFGLGQALAKAGIKQPLSHLVARLSF